MEILWINPLHSDAYDDKMAQDLQEIVSPGGSVHVLSFRPPGPQHLEYATHGVAVGPPLLSAVRWARANDFDAVCIGCFYDPGLRSARELAGPMVVTAPAEACLHTATVLGSRCSVLVANRTCLAEARHAVEHTGLGSRVASYRDLQMRVVDFQTNPEHTRARLSAEGGAAVADDGADVLVLGCTLEYGFGEELQKELGVPVLDATSTPLLFAEYLVGLSHRFRWRPSGADYQPPPEKELEWLPPAELPGPITSRSRRTATSNGRQADPANMPSEVLTEGAQ